jgi:hypothetical protein
LCGLRWRWRAVWKPGKLIPLRCSESTSAMKALSFWKAVTLDKSNLLEEVFALLQDNKVRFCVIGGQAVNAYVEPLVSLDLDLVVAVDQIGRVDKIMREHFQVEAFLTASTLVLRVPICECSFKSIRVTAILSSELPSVTCLASNFR